MRINIINLDKDKWILTKIAKRLCFNLKLLGHEVSIHKKPIKQVDVNHFIIFLFQKEKAENYFKNTVNTTMLTHINDDIRYNKIRNISKFMDAGIALSEDHAQFIKSKSLGLKKIFSVLPANDGDLKIKKIHFGIFTNLYNDGRKEEDFLCDELHKFDPNLIKISIIGKGWRPLVKKLISLGFEINYQRFFFRKRYVSQMKTIDYLIYLGQDEGSMSFLDALQLGIKTIMIPQGFQNDLKKYITFPVKKDLSNFGSIVKKIISQRKKFVEINKLLTWENYAKEHIKIWEELIRLKSKHH